MILQYFIFFAQGLGSVLVQAFSLNVTDKPTAAEISMLWMYCSSLLPQISIPYNVYYLYFKYVNVY